LLPAVHPRAGVNGPDAAPGVEIGRELIEHTLAEKLDTGSRGVGGERRDHLCVGAHRAQNRKLVDPAHEGLT
jgi:hypothetical protein